MGCGPFKVSKSIYDKSDRERAIYITVPTVKERVIERVIEKLPNPNPRNYRLKRSRRFGKKTGLGSYLAVEINYPDCTNFEGNKILVYEDTKLIELTRQGSIDPHFAANTHFKSPIARFVPTPKGWTMARNFCILMGNLT